MAFFFLYHCISTVQNDGIIRTSLCIQYNVYPSYTPSPSLVHLPHLAGVPQMAFYFPIFEKLFDSTEGGIWSICLSESVLICITWWSSVLSVSPKCYNFPLLYGWIIPHGISTSHSYLSIRPPFSDWEAVFSSLVLTFLKLDQERTAVMERKISRRVPEWMLCLDPPLSPPYTPTHPMSHTPRFSLFLNLSYFHFCCWRAWSLLLQPSTHIPLRGVALSSHTDLQVELLFTLFPWHLHKNTCQCSHVRHTHGIACPATTLQGPPYAGVGFWFTF